MVLNIACLQMRTMFNKKLLYIFILNECAEAIVTSNRDETNFVLLLCRIGIINIQHNKQCTQCPSKEFTPF